MTDPLITAANNISKASPAIRSFAQMSAARTIALEQKVAALTPAPPPPSTQRHLGNGYILFRYGDSWNASPVAGYERYGVVVVGYGNDTDAAKLSPAVGLGYRTPVELEDVADAALSTGGVTLTQARANGWLLKGADGTECMAVGYSGEWCGNLSNSGYQAACFATYRARAQATGLKGFFLDNVDPSPFWLSPQPANIAGGVSFDRAYELYLQAMRNALPDLYFLANCGPGGPAWVTRIAPYVNGVITENPSSDADLQSFVAAANVAGVDAFALISTDPAGALARQRATAFAAKWTKQSGGFGIDFGAPDPWNVNWISVIA